MYFNSRLYSSIPKQNCNTTECCRFCFTTPKRKWFKYRYIIVVVQFVSNPERKQNIHGLPFIRTLALFNDIPDGPHPMSIHEL